MSFLLLLAASVGLITAETLLAVWLGFLPGVEVPFGRRTR